MSQVACCECSKSVAGAEAYELNGKIYCDPCVKAAAERAKAAGQPVAVARYVDKSICARCNTYIGEGGGMAAGNARLCLACSEMVQNWPYPQWLKLSLAGLLLLLAFALLHGRKYFAAGKDLYRGEQLVEKGRYQEALPYLKATMKLAPNSDKGALLTAKAALLSGDVVTAAQVLESHDNGRFENADKPDFQEVKRLWNNANTAFEKLDKATKLEAQDGNEVEAAKLVHEAVAVYPQLPYANLVLDQYDEGVAFAKKDYDTFLALAERDWKLMPGSQTAAMISSALACKYAASGDTAFRQRSEEMLAKAKELAKGDKKILDGLAEFEERNRFRLETRQIISKSEYDRKFRSTKNAGN
jgi:tetratricopeptide (TPR) repeat protein